MRSKRAGFREMFDIPVSLPFRSIPQDPSYAFLRGINASAMFWQDPAAAAGVGKWVEPTDLGGACSDLTISAKSSKTVAEVNADTIWGFKEHPYMFGHFYIYTRSTNR